MSYKDRRYRIISYHDTWISLDPIQGCPYSCVYCVLRHADNTGVRPQVVVSPRECVEQLQTYPFFVREFTPVAIGNETDMLHRHNVDYLIQLLEELATWKLDNPIVLITKAPLTDATLSRIQAISRLRVIFFLSYSGLDRKFEPNFTSEQLQANFTIAKQYGFRVVHYWRPLLPQNTSPEQIRTMLKFASSIADATVFIGLKIHPMLTPVITQEGIIQVPNELLTQSGEWLDPVLVNAIYDEAQRICPEYPLYRHTACALANVLKRPNHTATIYRDDVCPPSHCPVAQRQICQAARVIPSERKIADILSVLRQGIDFQRKPDRIVIHEEVTQEQFVFLLHHLNCPLEVTKVKMENLYYGDIYKGQQKVE